MAETTGTKLARVTNARDKLLWGVRAAGVPAALRGSVRLAGLRLRRPHRSRIKVRSGFELEFRCPDQVPVALVAFGDLIDPEYRLLIAIARPDWVVVDVGAAIGQFTVFSAKRLGATVHAFEPEADNLVSLRQNIDVNGVGDTVDVHPVALSDHEGRSSFTSDTWVSGLDESAVAGTATEVDVRRLDLELERLAVPHVHVLKVNVAGYEPPVLRGARELLARGGADILVLLLGTDSFPVYADLADLGYRFFFFHPRRGQLHEVLVFDSSLLERRPWPARHIIGVHRNAIRDGLVDSFRICRESR